MKRNQVMLGIVIFLFLFLQKTMSQETVSSSAGEVLDNGGALSYTLGQAMYSTNSGMGGKVTQGVQQVYSIVEVSSFPRVAMPEFETTIYPNPAKDFFNIKIVGVSTSIPDGLKYLLYDIEGKLIQSEEIVTSVTRIDINHFKQSTYLLKLMKGESEIKVYTIIK